MKHRLFLKRITACILAFCFIIPVSDMNISALFIPVAGGNLITEDWNSLRNNSAKRTYSEDDRPFSFDLDSETIEWLKERALSSAGSVTEAILDYSAKKYNGIFEEQKRLLDAVKKPAGGWRRGSKWRKAQTMTAKKLKENTKIISTKSKIAKWGGRLVGWSVGAYEVKQMFDNPDVGYKSPFIEFCANTFRGMSIATNFVPTDQFPGINLIIETTTTMITNKALIENTNNSLPDKNSISGKILSVLDNVTEWNNKNWKESFEFFFDWYYENDVLSENELHLRELRQQKCAANGINVYKPNIYLYPPEQTDVMVKFEYPELLTKTVPVYDSGWNITAGPDGMLTADGEVNTYLFYESETDPYFYQTDEGFLIPAENRKEIFADIMHSYGFNETEIADFTEFWDNKLEADHSYSMYPQYTDTIDKAMPVSVSPKPDTYNRIWFVFIKDGQPENDAVPVPFERNGFAVVEWGGLILER